ncbi:HEPN domain-containing protein [Thermoflexus sp.]|uniref:HEPN domain-containing protein n=1 Tax=Thermoflexus sp. TaxID=1969742 RepID=UPI0017516F46|nr:HEPN domain-containing protein [Thermoflexus sp.]
MNRWRDWWKQAQADLRHAQESLRLEDYEWACFAAHQAPEKALQALYLKRNQIAWGHSVRLLLEQIGEAIPEDLLQAARILDKYYIGPRYPNAHPAGAPFELYTRREALEAIRFAEEILDYVRSDMEG